MCKFIFADESISLSTLLFALALIGVSGCASVYERDVGRDIELQALDPVAVGKKPAGQRCRIHHMYVCERQLRTDPGTCYCVPEPASLRAAPEVPQRLF